MKAYCLNCGHPNEYSGVMPNKCEKCGTEFAVARVEFKIPVHQSSSNTKESVKEFIQDQLEGSEFDSFMQGDAEPFSEDEIKRIFLKDADRGINLRDLMAEGAKKQTQVKAKKRASKRK